jgi:hypothetical protein
MQDVQTYQQYAEECRRLAQSMPGHRTALLDMAAVWADLASRKAQESEGKADGKSDK